MCKKRKKGKGDEAWHTKSEKAGQLPYALLLLIFVLLIISAVVAVCCYFAFSKRSDGNSINNFLAIFSLLITMIAVFLPLGSYFINQSQIEKITKESNQEIEKITKESNRMVQEQDKQFRERMDVLDDEYLELFESIIKRRSIGYLPTDNDYMKVGKDYVNALACFSDGAYSECGQNLQQAVDKIIYDPAKFLQTNEHAPLLIYKVFNLYRKLLGRKREPYTALVSALSKLMGSTAVKENPQYQAILFLYVKSKFDSVEKIPTFMKDLPFEEFKKLEDVIEGSQFIDWMKYTLLAKHRYIRAYFYRDNINENHKQAIIYCLPAYTGLMAIMAKSTGGNRNSELEYEIIKSCAFMVVKVLEQSYYVESNEKQRECLTDAGDILKKLIERQIDAKYYLELSNVYKKLSSVHEIEPAEAQRYLNESNYAAQYGYNLAPTDPLLAAQCAYVYLRKYLLDSTVSTNLMEARACIETAHWIYTEEKERNKDAVHSYSGSNVRFSYIASLFATIEAYTLIASTKPLSELKNHLSRIWEDIDNSIADDSNNVANYRRAFLIYYVLYSYAKGTRDKAHKKEFLQEVIKELIKKIEKFKENEAFQFSSDDLFCSFSSAIRKISTDGANGDKIINELKGVLEEPAKCI